MTSRTVFGFGTWVLSALLIASPASSFAFQSGPGAPQAAAPAQTTRRVVVDIKGMYCESCEKTIHAMLMRTAGVKSASVSTKAGRAIVVYDGSQTSPQNILATINKLGYTAHLARGAERAG